MNRSSDFPPLTRDFYARDVVTVARKLLGHTLIHEADSGCTTGRIVEVEAYLADGDTASHGHRGPTPRNSVMFGPPGHAYVYAIHSRWCLNAVTESPGRASAVLIRAIEPLTGIEIMQSHRRMDKPGDLCRGPARLCEALAINRDLNGWDLTLGQRLWITHPPDAPSVTAADVATTTRVGVTSAQHLPLRFVLAGNPYISKPRQR